MIWWADPNRVTEPARPVQGPGHGGRRRGDRARRPAPRADRAADGRAGGGPAAGHRPAGRARPGPLPGPFGHGARRGEPRGRHPDRRGDHLGGGTGRAPSTATCPTATCWSASATREGVMVGWRRRAEEVERHGRRGRRRSPTGSATPRRVAPSRWRWSRRPSRPPGSTSARPWPWASPSARTRSRDVVTYVATPELLDHLGVDPAAARRRRRPHRAHRAAAVHHAWRGGPIPRWSPGGRRLDVVPYTSGPTTLVTPEASRAGMGHGAGRLAASPPDGPDQRAGA